MPNVESTSVNIDKNRYKRLRKVLIDKEKTFSEWLREKMDEEIEVSEKVEQAS